MYAMTLRGLGLMARFGLVAYMAKYLSLSEVGAFGLIAGIVGMAPAILGWGVNYFMSRELVDVPIARAGWLIRDRLLLTLCTVAVAFALAGCAYLISGAPMPRFAVPIAIIVVLECVAFDSHMSLVSLRMPLAANGLLFLRSSAWALPAIGLGLVFPSARNLELILWLWVLGLVLSFGLLAIVIRRWPLSQIMRSPVEMSSMSARVKRAWLIYLNDVAIVGALYLDRYIVAKFLGLQMAGVFTLLWSIANGMHVLVHTGVIQLAAPSLISAARLSLEEWRRAIGDELKKLVAIGTLLGLTLFFAVRWGMPSIGISQMSGHDTFFAILLLATLVRLVSDLSNTGLFSLGLDQPLALINLVTLVLSLATTALGAVWLGLLGVGYALLFSAGASLSIRAFVLRRHWIQNQAVKLASRTP